MGRKHPQSIQMESADSVVVSENIYDVMGSQVIKTKRARVGRHRNGFLMNYYRPDFITDVPDGLLTLRSTPNDAKLNRLVDDLNPADEGFPYSRTLYESCPLARLLEREMPDRLFAIGGQFTWRTEHNPMIAAQPVDGWPFYRQNFVPVFRWIRKENCLASTTSSAPTNTRRIGSSGS